MPEGTTAGTMVYSDVMSVTPPTTNGTITIQNVYYTCKKGADPTGANLPTMNVPERVAAIRQHICTREGCQHDPVDYADHLCGVPFGSLGCLFQRM